METELKAAVARQAAEAAAKEEAVAARLAFATTQPPDEVIEPMAIEVVVSEPSIQIRARRYFFFCNATTLL